MRHWTLDDIDWSRFDPACVDADLLCVARAAALVEGNADDYVTYLRNVFHDDPEFVAAAEEWGAEERQHGKALARWCRLADPTFDYEAAMARFRCTYRLPVEAAGSVRGSRAGELVARCIVECGTSSFYSAIRDASHEPVLREVAARIAGDEFRHFRLFERHLRRHLIDGRPGRLGRLRIALGRVIEIGDDELAAAYWSGNAPGETYDRRRHAKAYEARAWRIYRFGHIQRGIGMALKACDMDPQGWLSRSLARLGYRYLSRRASRLARAPA